MSSKTPGQPCIYARISLDRDQSQLATERQIHECRAKAQALGWGDIPDSHVYRDESISASKKIARPEYERMLKALEAGHHDALLVYDMDRLTRKPRDLEDFIDLAESKSIILANVSGDVDLSTASGKTYARIKGAIAKQESDRIGERVREAHKQRARLGYPPKGVRMFGYDKDFNVVPEQAEAITKAIDFILAGGSVSQSVKFFEHLPTMRRDKGHTNTWYYGTVKKIITNPLIAGRSVLKGEDFGKGNWTPIISESTLKAIQDHFKQHPRHGVYATGEHLLSGIARCGNCNTRLYPKKVGRNQQYSYCCFTNVASKDRAVKPCGKIVRNEDKVDEHINKIMSAYFAQATPKKPVPKQYQSDIAALEQELVELDQARQDGLSVGAWSKARIDVENRLQGYIDLQAKQTAEHAKAQQAASLDWDSLDISEKRKALVRVIDSIHIMQVGKGKIGPGRQYPYESIVITWKK